MKNKGNKRNINQKVKVLIVCIIIIIFSLILTIIQLAKKYKKIDNKLTIEEANNPTGEYDDQVNSATIEKPSNPIENSENYSNILYDYFKDMDSQQVQDVNTVEDKKVIWLFTGYRKDTFPDYVEYKNGIYKIIYTNIDMYNIKEVVKVNANVDFNKKGIYDIDGIPVLITPEFQNELIHTPIDLSQYIGNIYCLKENGTDIDLNKKVTGNIYSVNENVCNSSGEVINIINAEGPMSFTAYYYLKDNEEPDINRPFEKGYYSNVTNSYYDITGKLVDVIMINGGE